jgi:hypothetical protein
MTPDREQCLALAEVAAFVVEVASFVVFLAVETGKGDFGEG